MRPVLRGLAVCVVVLTASRPATAQQQGSLQITAAAHTVNGNTVRTGEPTFEPDVGVSWLRPGTRFGMFQIEIRGTQRDSRAILGKTLVALRDWRWRGITWTFEGGDSWFSPSGTDYRVTNLSTLTFTFAGGSIKARTARTNLAVMAGRATAWRNIFGTDAEVLDQSIAFASGTYSLSERLEIAARGSRIRTSDLGEFTFFIADSDQAGGGVRYILTPAVRLLADGSVVSYRRRELPQRELDGSALAGVSVLLARGWLQLNVSRFSPGELPVMNQPRADRETLFAAGEYDLFRRMRVLGGWERFRTNLDPKGAADAGRLLSETEGARVFSGLRIGLGGGSIASVRYEDGDRRSRYIGAAPIRISDTGVFTGEFQNTSGPLSTFLRYARRAEVEAENVYGTYTQHDTSALGFYNFSRTVQAFGSAARLRNVSASGDAFDFWQFGGGGQARLRNPGLWLRAEGLVTRNIDLLRDRHVPHERVSLGLNGEVARNTIIGINIYADRYEVPPGSLVEPWTVRSTFRVSRIFPSTRTASTKSIGTMSRHSGTGSVMGIVFADWNGNGQQDTDDMVLENIPIRLAALGSATTSRTGEFAFVDVPVGLQEVGIDLTSLPVDFDPPAVPRVQLALGRGETKVLSFALLPLGAIRGRVLRDVNADGRQDAGDEPLDGAVATLNNGMRSELVRGGEFRFDAVRAGQHTVELLPESLPDGASVVGGATITVTIARNALMPEATFLVQVQQRPEIRKVFPPDTPLASSGSAPVEAPRPAAPGRSLSPRAERASPSPASKIQVERFAAQIAASSDLARARRLVEQLRAEGYASYLVAPPSSDPRAPYRIRVGQYATREAAEQAARTIEAQRREKVWVIRER